MRKAKSALETSGELHHSTMQEKNLYHTTGDAISRVTSQHGSHTCPLRVSHHVCRNNHLGIPDPEGIPQARTRPEPRLQTKTSNKPSY